MADRRLIGKVRIKVDGREYAIFKGATLDPGGEKRTTQSGSTSVLGFTGEIVPSKIEIEPKFGAGDKLTDFDWTNATVEFIADTGQTYVLPSAWRTDTPQLGDDGKVKIVIEGDPAEEML